MVIEGKVWKSTDSEFWLAEVPLLDILTQAERKEDVPAMVQDALESLVNDSSFSAIITMSDNQLFIESHNPKKLIGFMLKRQRNKKGLTQDEVVQNLHKASSNDYAQYEQARHMPSFEKLQELLQAIDPYLKLYVSSVEDTHELVATDAV